MSEQSTGSQIEQAKAVLLVELQQLQNRVADGYRLLHQNEELLNSIEEIEELEADVGILCLSITFGKDRKLQLDIWLASSKQDSTIVRSLAKSLGMTLHKEQSYTGARTLIATGENERIKIIVRDYLPRSCNLVEYEEEVPAHTVKKYKIDCGANNDD